MKLIKIMIASIIVTCFSHVAFANGSSVRGGGDEVGLEFQVAYLTALEDIKQNYPDLEQKIQKTDISRIAHTARIFVVDAPLFINDGVRQEVTAMNDPTTAVITISRPRWLAITNPFSKSGIALHEVLSLVRLEATGFYPISSIYVQRINRRNQN